MKNSYTMNNENKTIINYNIMHYSLINFNFYTFNSYKLNSKHFNYKHLIHIQCIIYIVYYTLNSLQFNHSIK